MKDFEKDKLRADILKQCELELRELKKIEEEIERNAALEALYNKYQKMLLTIGLNSWQSLLDIENLTNP